MGNFSAMMGQAYSEGILKYPKKDIFSEKIFIFKFLADWKN